MAILIMGKYAISKLSIILYHKETDLSIGFAKVFSRYETFSKKRNEIALLGAISWLFFLAETFIIHFER